jgi:site-specific DNA recombinase
VSTARQGERSVSLPEQKGAIERYAEHSNLTIVEWFEERETAAKLGRPIWTRMLRELRRGRAKGVIIHKIDRSARNLKDWADLGELIDQGIEVHFANESLDLHSRGGRLSADIQAVVASDYIRNLREETKKGLYGRLKQGFYPMRAPIGYLDNGAAKAKTIDPTKGPLVKKCFDLYANGQWSIPRLVEEMYRRGLRNHAAQRVTRNGMHSLLRNPFYTGIMRIKASGATYIGNHEALVPKTQFDRVQDILHGRVGTRVNVHHFLFRRFIRCAKCGYSLIGELQKGHVYYRCHKKECPKTIIREDLMTERVEQNLQKIRFTARESEHLRIRLAELKTSWAKDREAQLQALRVRIEQLVDRMNRLTDAYLDQSLDKAMFEERRAALLQERRTLEDTKRDWDENRRSIPDVISHCVELAGTAKSLYQNGSAGKKRLLLQTLVSNCAITYKTLDFVWQIPFQQIADRGNSDDGSPSKVIGRTDLLIEGLVKLFTEHPDVLPVGIQEWS